MTVFENGAQHNWVNLFLNELSYFYVPSAFTFLWVDEIALGKLKKYFVKLQVALWECSGSFKDVLSNTVICFWGIPKEFRRKMTVLLDISDKDPLHSHCYHVNDCQKSNFVTKRRSAFLYWKKMPSSFY